MKSSAAGISAALELCLAIMGLGGCTQAKQSAPRIIVTELRVPTAESTGLGLEAVMVRPSDPVPHPLALLTHGIPRQSAERANMTPLALIPQAREFARRGWTAVVVMRQGFGGSGGVYAEDDNACGGAPDFLRTADAAAKQLREAATYLATRPEVDPSRMIGVGVSAGGLAMVALSNNPPPGMAAAISFAGGRGSDAPDHVCSADALVDTFGRLGRHSKIPMLWIYAANDHFFGPQLAQSLYQAFTVNGGDAMFVAAPPFGGDGHMLFSLLGIPIWAPMVDQFLSAENLVLRETPLPPSLPSVRPPSYLSTQGRIEFQLYLAAAPHKAFATSPGGQFGYIYGQRTADEAQRHAIETCAKFAPNYPCAAVMVDDDKVQN